MDMNELNRDAERSRLVDQWNNMAPRYDSFPSTVQLVREPAELLDPMTALYLGRRIGYASITRQVRVGNVQLKGMEAIFDGDDATLRTVYITRPAQIGTGEHGHNPNFEIVARRHSQLWVAEIGCFHDFGITGRSNCWIQHTCSKCQWGYEIDSGD